MKDGLNIKAALNSLTEHFFCIVPADDIFVCLIFPIKCKLPHFFDSTFIYQQKKNVISVSIK